MCQAVQGKNFILEPYHDLSIKKVDICSNIISTNNWIFLQVYRQIGLV